MSAARTLYRRRLGSDERLFGLGDKAAPLDRRGGGYVLWNTDNPDYSLGTDPLYKAIPLVFGVSTETAWCVYVESTARLEFDCRGAELRVLGPGKPRVHELEGPTFSDVFARAAALVGRASLPPRWALGYHQSRWSYPTAAEALDVAREFRRRRIPLEVLHLDIDMNEPSLGERKTLPDDAVQAQGTHHRLHNAYGHGMAQATVEALADVRPRARPFVRRSGGTPRRVCR